MEFSIQVGYMLWLMFSKLTNRYNSTGLTHMLLVHVVYIWTRQTRHFSTQTLGNGASEMDPLIFCSEFLERAPGARGGIVFEVGCGSRDIFHQNHRGHEYNRSVSFKCSFFVFEGCLFVVCYFSEIAMIKLRRSRVRHGFRYSTSVTTLWGG